jgi:hypothetical protein
MMADLQLIEMQEFDMPPYNYSVAELNIQNPT